MKIFRRKRQKARRIKSWVGPTNSKYRQFMRLQVSAVLWLCFAQRLWHSSFCDIKMERCFYTTIKLHRLKCTLPSLPTAMNNLCCQLLCNLSIRWYSHNPPIVASDLCCMKGIDATLIRLLQQQHRANVTYLWSLGSYRKHTKYLITSFLERKKRNAEWKTLMNSWLLKLWDNLKVICRNCHCK